MDLSARLRGISTEVGEKPSPTSPIIRTLPSNEIQNIISKVCFSGMHYPDITKARGTLVSCYGISDETLIENAEFVGQFIDPSSETMKGKTVRDVFRELQKAYPAQAGSFLLKNLVPADCFPKDVYDNLPEDIARIVLLIEDPRKRDVCLMGIITALSAAFSRYRFYHGADGDLKEYSPHLISVVLGAAGSGKGLTRYGSILVAAITHRALQMQKESQEMYKKKKHDYDRERKQREKDGRAIDDLHEPVKPPKYCFAMSASDTTQAALVEILNQNPIGGYAYDSEVDTLVQGNMKKDFGGFSDVIRKVFHHEPLARQRKGEGESYIVEQPRLAVMLSGTHDQLRKLIPSEYNGLFSRFWYYSIPKTFLQYTIAKQQTDVVGEMCQSLQTKILQLADLWSDELISMSFSQDQEMELMKAMQDKQYAEDKHGGDIGASWLRMALMVKRIAVTLAGVQGSEGGVVPTNCWRAAISLLPSLKSHCVQALEVIRQNNGKLDLSEEEYNKLKNEGKTDEAIAAAWGCSAKTLQRRKVDWTKVPVHSQRVDNQFKG